MVSPISNSIQSIQNSVYVASSTGLSAQSQKIANDILRIIKTEGGIDVPEFERLLGKIDDIVERTLALPYLIKELGKPGATANDKLAAEHIKNLNYGTKVPDNFIGTKSYERLMQENPTGVTKDGVLILNPVQQKALEESVGQAFNGSKNPEKTVPKLLNVRSDGTVQIKDKFFKISELILSGSEGINYRFKEIRERASSDQRPLTLEERVKIDSAQISISSPNGGNVWQISVQPGYEKEAFEIVNKLVQGMNNRSNHSR